MTAPEKEWRCFHCDEVFTDSRSARLHFGADEGATPACRIKGIEGSEGGLLWALRDAERDAADAWAAVHAESAEGVKAFIANLSRHSIAMRSAEETGYARGIADAAPAVATFAMICAGAAAYETAADDDKFTRVWAAMRAVALGLTA